MKELVLYIQKRRSEKRVSSDIYMYGLCWRGGEDYEISYRRRSPYPKKYDPFVSTWFLNQF